MDKIINLFKDKKIILASLLIIISTILLIVSIPKEKKEKNYNNTKKGVIERVDYNGVKFTNISLVTENGYTTFKATVTNNSETDIKDEELYINLKDKDGNVIVKLLGFIPDGLKKGESKKIVSSVKGDYSEAYSKEIVDYSIDSRSA